MDPESLRRCMSFGFSDKQSESFIGQCMKFLLFNLHAFQSYFLFLLLFLCFPSNLLCWNIDGNGFKTSTMRLGADVIVFSRCRKNMYLLMSNCLCTSCLLTILCYDQILI